ncbi:cell wall hydrolase [Brevundimonas sp. TWP2-3-2]|uniref:cell wall hydrolase n=1 Tax=unclassified Brevundimonas TaxID=2622653 RepID=UPI003CF3B12E
MSANPDTLIAVYRPTSQRRLALLLEAITHTHWTPVVVCILSIVFLLGACSAVLVQARLAEIALAQATGGEPDAVPLMQGPALTDFSLAPEAIRPITMDEARAFNAALPFSNLPVQAARPFIMPADDLVDYSRALDCLTAAVYYEAASETGPGQAAVAQVVINRMRHPAFPKTVCGVVFQGQERTTGCQFSFTCDGALTRTPSVAGWQRARAAAGAALNGLVAAEVGMATHYHTDWVAPYWAERLVKLRQIGTHIFYRWTGGWGLPPAFTGVHSGEEPVIGNLAALATPLDEPPPPLVEIGVETFDLRPPLPVEIPAPPAALVTAVPDPDLEPAPPVVASAPPPPPAILANPLAPPTASAAPRRSRIAVPRD